MIVTANSMMFLESRSGDFQPDDGADKIHYQNATFFQKDGSTCTLKVDKSIDISKFVETSYYDLTIEFREVSYGRGKAFVGRVLDYVETYGG